MKTQYTSKSGMHFILRSLIISPYRPLTDGEKEACRSHAHKHCPSASMLYTKALSDCGEACFGFEVHLTVRTGIYERCRNFFSKLKTAALDYINISTVFIKIVI